MSELGIFYPAIPDGATTNVTLTASGDNLSGDISLADLKTALSNGVVLLSFPTDGNADERVVAEYTDDSTNGLRIGVFSEDEYIVYSVVDDGSNGITLTTVREKGIGGAGVLVISPTMTSQTAGYSDDVTFAQVKQHIIAGGSVAVAMPSTGIYWILSNPSFMPMGMGANTNILSFLAFNYDDSTSSSGGEYTRIDLMGGITVNVISIANSVEHGCTFFLSAVKGYIDNPQ